MAEALYRKYRPSTFSDVVGQGHIEKTLQNAIEQNKVSHAYLFCGPRGTGKTTTARILAKALLCEKAPTIDPDGTCPECQAIANGTHPDVYELDAASRTGVENVREEIINRVHYAPVQGSVKVYIIDEVHMLSTAAFNALLKTLEEPPDHVIFILCTTDPQKVPETIHSRCQRFDFHRISPDAIVARLGAICVQEGVSFEPEALELIAYRAEGGMRNALTSLEQLMAFGEGNVTLAGAQNLLGSMDDSGLAEIVSAIGRRDVATCFKWTARYVETGADLANFAADLSLHIRNLYLLSVTQGDITLSVSDATRTAMEAELDLFTQDRLARLLGVLDDVIKELRVSSNPRLSFEIALTRMVRPESDLTLEALAERVERLEHFETQVARQQISGAASVQGASAPVQTATPAAPAPKPASQPSAPTAQPVIQPLAQPAAAQPSVQSAAAQSTVSQPAPQPVAAPMPAAAPAPASAPAQPAPQPSIQQPVQAAVQPSAQAPTSASAPVSAPAPAQPVPAPAAPASTPAVPTPAPAAQVDLSSPAKFQRFWNSVMSYIRKEDSAKAALFMRANVSTSNDNTTILIGFEETSEFAYEALRKPEVQQLLKEAIIAVAGSPVPYQLAVDVKQLQPQLQSRQQQLQPSAPQPSQSAVPQPSASSAVTQPSVQSAVAQSTVAQPVQEPTQPTPQPVAAPQTNPPAPASAVSAPASQPSAQPAPSPQGASPTSEQPAVSEEEEVENILKGTFGEGIKFS